MKKHKPLRHDKPFHHFTTCLALCVELKGTDKAVTALCKKMVKTIARNERHMIYQIMSAPSPLKYASGLLGEQARSGLTDRHTQALAEEDRA